MRRLVATIAIAGWSSAAADARVDWARGLVIADGIGLADRHAPNPAVARGTSRRAAEDVAKAVILKEILRLPIAGGSELLKQGSARTRLDRAIEEAVALDADPETDGSWHVTLAVPIEAVRQAIAGPRELPDDGDSVPPVVVVEGVSGKPMVGALDAATLWVKGVPDWAKDAQRVRGRRGKDGAITLDKRDVHPGALYVVIAK
jgi:hypothetical protein